MATPKKEQIRLGAIEVIAQEGFHRATTDKIAAAAGVAVGTIYNYFRSKDDILHYIFTVEYEKRAALLRELQGQQLHPLEKIQAILDFHFARVEKNPDLIKVVVAERAFSCDHQNNLTLLLEGILAEGIRDGKIRSCDPGLMATMLFGAIEGVMVKYLQDVDGGKALLMVAGEELALLLWQGLGIK